MKQKTININKETKKAKNIIYNYEKAVNNGYLYQVYNKWSYKKFRAWKTCEILRTFKNGFDTKIVSYNKNIFTYGFLYKNDNNKVCLYYITPKKEYNIKLY